MDATQRWQLLPDAAGPAVVDTVELRQYELGAFLAFLNERESLVPMYPDVYKRQGSTSWTSTPSRGVRP